MILRIGTRASKLALKQSEWIKGKIETTHPGVNVDLIKIKTKGDKILDSPLSKIGGKGLFVKEIEDALLEKRVDLAVHSMKDVPAELPDRLMLSTFPSRYLFTIGRQLVFSLTRWAAQIHTGFHVSRATQEFPCAHSCFRIRGFHPLWIAIPRNSPNIHDTRYWAPTTPVR